MDQETKQLPSLEDIIKEVSMEFMVGVNELRGPLRIKELREPRKILCLLFRRLRGDISLKTMGEFLNNRDHSTIIHNAEAAEDIMFTDPEYKKQYEKLLSSFR